MMERIRLSGKCRVLFGFGDGVTQEEQREAFRRLRESLSQDSEIKNAKATLLLVQRDLIAAQTRFPEGEYREQMIDRFTSDLKMVLKENKELLIRRVRFWMEEIARNMNLPADSLFRNAETIADGLRGDEEKFRIYCKGVVKRYEYRDAILFSIGNRPDFWEYQIAKTYLTLWEGSQP